MSIIKMFMLVAAALITFGLVSDPGNGAAIFAIFAALAVGVTAAIVEEN